MNQFYRATHMPLGRLVRKMCGEKEIYTIALRRREVQPGTDPLPALGGKPYTPIPYQPGYWFADPVLYSYGGLRWLFAERMNRTTGKGDIVAWTLDDALHLGSMMPVLEEDYHLSFPNLFDWGGELWMIPETGANKSLNLYRCTGFPNRWEKACVFDVGCELADTIILDKSTDALLLLCSECSPENQLYVRYRRYYLRRKLNNFLLEEDEAFNLQHKDFDLTSRNAGPMFLLDGMAVHPTQVSTEVDYGVYLQFMAQRPGGEVPLCAATVNNVAVLGIDPKDYIGVHTYCKDDKVEVIDLRYLRKVEKIQPAPAQPTPQPAPAAPNEVEIAPAEELQQELEKAHLAHAEEPDLDPRDLPQDLPELPDLETLQHTLREQLLDTEHQLEAAAEAFQDAAGLTMPEEEAEINATEETEENTESTESAAPEEPNEAETAEPEQPDEQQKEQPDEQPEPSPEEAPAAPDDTEETKVPQELPAEPKQEDASC